MIASRRLAVLVAFTAFVGGCGEDAKGPSLTQPVTLQDVPARFVLIAGLDVTDPLPDAPARWHISAGLDPGRVSGTTRTSTDTLWVNGEPLLPERVDDNGRRTYATVLNADLAEAHLRVIEVRPPMVAGLLPPGDISFVGVGRPPGDTATWLPQTDLVLPVYPPAHLPDPGASSLEWDLRVIGLQNLGTSLRGSGLPPQGLTVPGWSRPAEGDSLRAYFSAGFAGSAPAPPLGASDYQLVYNISARLFWRIHIGQ